MRRQERDAIHESFEALPRVFTRKKESWREIKKIPLEIFLVMENVYIAIAVAVALNSYSTRKQVATDLSCVCS